MDITDENRDSTYRSGYLSREEFKVYSKVNGVEGWPANFKFNRFDVDGDGEISRDEFVRAALDELNEEQIRALAKEGKEPDYVKKQTEKVNKAREELKSK